MVSARRCTRRSPSSKVGSPVDTPMPGRTLRLPSVRASSAGIGADQLSAALPANRMGVYMGIFNFFIVIPQILVAIVLSRVMEHFEGVNRLTAVVIGGVCMLVAAGFTLLVKDDSHKSPTDLA